MCIRIKVLALALFLSHYSLFSERVCGWGPGGHRVVANLAYDRLDPAVRSKIVECLRQHPDFKKRFAGKMPDDIAEGPDEDRWIFLQAAIWPDLVRPFPPFHHGSWHFMNIPFFLTPHDQAALQDVIKPNVSLTIPHPLTPAAHEHMNCAQALKLCLQELNDSHTTEGEKAICYCWVLHIVGDIHQPLHSTGLVTRGRFNTAEGDRGGNSIKIKQGKNLHSFWDGLLGGDQTLNSIRQRSAAILGSDKLKQAAEKASSQLAIEVWLQESNAMAKNFAYDKLVLDEVAAREADAMQPLQKVDLPVEYRKEAGRLAQQRVAEAGYRLAEVLKQVSD